jgi:hypothetical protein
MLKIIYSLLALACAIAFIYVAEVFLGYFLVLSITTLMFCLFFLMGFVKDLYDLMRPKTVDDNPPTAGVAFSEKDLSILEYVLVEKIKANPNDLEPLAYFLQARCATPNVAIGLYSINEAEKLFKNCISAMQKNSTYIKNVISDEDNPFKDFELGNNDS